MSDAVCREVGGIFLFSRNFAHNGFLSFGWVTTKARAKNTLKTYKNWFISDFESGNRSAFLVSTRKNAYLCRKRLNIFENGKVKNLY